MKKLAFGCGIVVLLVGVVVVGVGYYGYMKVKSTVSQFAELRKIPDIERDIRVKTPFTVPASHELTQAQVDRFMQVETRVRQRLGQNFEMLQRNYKSLADKKEATLADLPQLMSAYRDMAKAWLDAKHEQVAALNDAGMSLDEYRWIRSATYQALGIPLVDVDYAKIAEQVNAGHGNEGTVLMGGVFSGQAPPGNIKLVEKYRKQFEDNAPLAAFGL